MRGSHGRIHELPRRAVTPFRCQVPVLTLRKRDKGCKRQPCTAAGHATVNQTDDCPPTEVGFLMSCFESLTAPNASHGPRSCCVPREGGRSPRISRWDCHLLRSNPRRNPPPARVADVDLAMSLLNQYTACHGKDMTVFVPEGVA